MTSPPQVVTDVFAPAPDPGKQLVDPSAFYQMIQLTLGYQAMMAGPTAPGPQITVAVTRVGSAPGAGPWQVQLPVALGGLRLTIINLAGGNLFLNGAYNPVFNRPDQVIGTVPMPSGNVYAAVAYQPGSWYVAPVATGLSPLLPEPPDDTPPEEC